MSKIVPDRVSNVVNLMSLESLDTPLDRSEKDGEKIENRENEKVWVCTPDAQLLRHEHLQSGDLDDSEAAPETVLQMFAKTVQEHANSPAMRFKRFLVGSTDITPDWVVITYQQYWDRSLSFAKGLLSVGLSRFSVVNIVGFNSPEWFIANIGTLAAGCISSGFYAGSNSTSCQYMSEHSKAEVVVVEGLKNLLKYVSIIESLPTVKAIVMWGDPSEKDCISQYNLIVPVYFWDDFLLLGKNISDKTVRECYTCTHPGNCATIIYTSGTTGASKAVMISHDNFTWTARQMLTCITRKNDVPVSHEDTIISYLPLSHVAAQTIDLYCPMRIGGCTYFAQSDALKGSLLQTLKEVRPTIFFGVPRVWEKFHEKLLARIESAKSFRKMLFRWATKVALRRTLAEQFNTPPVRTSCTYSPLPLSSSHLADILVIHKVKAALGLDRAHTFFTGSAPIAVETINFFASIDIAVLEVFGLSECTGPHSVSTHKRWRIGYCGPTLPGTESIIDPVTGELIIRGRHIFMGYMYMPAETAKVIDRDGFFHTGDMAILDSFANPSDSASAYDKDSMFVKITGRIKELIITAGGENITPVLIENQILSTNHAISNCMVVGDRRKFLAVLLTLKVDVDPNSGEPTENLTEEVIRIGKTFGSHSKTVSDVEIDPLWKNRIDAGIAQANALSTWNTMIVQKWKLIRKDFSERGGELTMTLKLKRSKIAEMYAKEIDEIYK